MKLVRKHNTRRLKMQIEKLSKKFGHYFWKLSKQEIMGAYMQ